MSDTDSIIVSNIKNCMTQLNLLVNYKRPKYPHNSESTWALFKDEMKNTVLFFRGFILNVKSVVKLRSTKNSLDRADARLKEWAGKNESLYNPTQGDLLSTLLWCKEIIQYFLTNRSLMSQKIQNDVNASQEILTEMNKHNLITLQNLNLMEVKSQVDVETLLCRMKELND